MLCVVPQGIPNYLPEGLRWIKKWFVEEHLLNEDEHDDRHVAFSVGRSD